MSPRSQDAWNQSLKNYKDKAKKAREAQERAQEANLKQQGQKDAEKAEKKAQNAEDAAQTAEKDRHLAALALNVTHQRGEENGCVTRCVRSEPSAATGWQRKCLYQGHDYRENGFKYQLDNESDWYNLDFHVEGSAAQLRLIAEATLLNLNRKTTNNPIKNPGAWSMTEAGKNFRWAGYPWGKKGNEAHHIVPVGSLYYAFQEDLGILQRAKYNINKGLNIIILPTRESYSRIYQLPAHLGGHKTYNNAVRLRLQGMKDALARAKSKPGGHPELAEKTAENWKNELEQFSLTMRRSLRKMAIAKVQAGLELKIDTIFSRTGLSR